MGRIDLKFLVIFCVMSVAIGVSRGADRRSRDIAVSVYDEAGRRLRGVFEGLPPNAKLAADDSWFKPAPSKQCSSLLKRAPIAAEQGSTWARFQGLLKRLLSIPVVHAIDCPWCYDPGNCTGQHFTCQAMPCFSGCGGDYNHCFTSPVAPAWKGYCVSNEIVCPNCPQCQERECWNG